MFLFQGVKIPKKVLSRQKFVKISLIKKTGFHLTSQSFVKTKICKNDCLMKKKTGFRLTSQSVNFHEIERNFFFEIIFYYYPCANCIFVALGWTDSEPAAGGHHPRYRGLCRQPPANHGQAQEKSGLPGTSTPQCSCACVFCTISVQACFCYY